MGALALPAMKLPPGNPAPPARRSNRSIARDFLDLSSRLESGRALPVFSRFEGPVTLKTTGLTLSAASRRDLAALLARLRNEGHVPIRLASAPAPATATAQAPANITVEFLPHRLLQRKVPQAACFVAPNVSSWREYLAHPGDPAQDWASIVRRRRVAIFIPGDVAPQEIRDCMHEEIAQALGPVNDLFRLTDSVYNDDNFQTVLTGFDMLILRATYDPALRSGMDWDTVAARLPTILSRIHPAGEHAPARAPVAPTPRSWIEAIRSALGRGTKGPAQIAQARHALAIARAQGWNDNRLGFSLYALGRVSLGSDPHAALEAFAQAEAIFRARPQTRLHAAHVAVQLAAYALSAGRARAAIDMVDADAPVALAAENAELLSSLLMIKAQALEDLGRSAQARIVRLDALGWARYGLGSGEAIARRLAEIAALSPKARRRASG